MTLGEWLDSRTPPAPPALLARMRSALGDRLTLPAEKADALCLAAGEALLADLLASGRTSRDGAIDLLAADGLVTYAFEAASERPAGPDGLARDAIEWIARVPARLSGAEPVSG